MSQSIDSAERELQDFDKEWNYSAPDKTAERFTELVPDALAKRDTSYYLQLLTQIARCNSLQFKFKEAHEILDEVEALLTDDYPIARVRYLLERGRSFNSANESDSAAALFTEAWELSRRTGAEYHAVDAAHMLGIAFSGERGNTWNLRAVEAAESSSNARARGWLAALYNNIAWYYHDEAGDFQLALNYFEQSRDAYQAMDRANAVRIARWSIGRAYRSLGRLNEALSLQLELEREYEMQEKEDGFVFEEIGECLLALQRADESSAYFLRAYKLLKDVAWLKAGEPERLERLKKLADGEDD